MFYVFAAFRIGLILSQFLDDKGGTVTWIQDVMQSASVLSVLVRPSQTLVHLREARAVQNLVASSKSFGAAYLANDSIRIPPLLLAAFMQVLDTSNPELWISILSLVVDILITILLQQIGKNVLLKTSPRISAEEQKQRKLPKIIHPENADIFPVYQQTNGEATRSLISMDRIPLLMAQLYFFSPFTIFPSSLGHCWQNLPALFLLMSISQGAQSSLTISSFSLALAAYLEPFLAVFSIPILFLLASTEASKGSLTASSLLSTTTAFLILFLISAFE